MLRSCYRGWWRLNTDPAILTPGRFYFAPEGTPACPVGTLRGSRNYVAENGESFLEWGEVDGKQKWDNGAPPIFVPQPRLIGTEACLTGDGSGDAPGVDPASDFFRVVCIGGQDYHFPTIVFVSFSVAYHDSEFTYFNDVPLVLVDAECEARYEGPSGIPNTFAVIRVTDGVDELLETNFYLVDNSTPPPPPIEVDCCDEPVNAIITQTIRVYGSVPAGPLTEVWSMLFEDIEMVYYATSPSPVFGIPDHAGWYACFDCDLNPADPATCDIIVRKWCAGGGTFWSNEIYTRNFGPVSSNLIHWDTTLAETSCVTGRAEFAVTDTKCSDYGGTICTHSFDDTFGDFLFLEME